MKFLLTAIMLLGSALFGREEVIVTIPKSGTHYLIELLNLFPNKFRALCPVIPDQYPKLYYKFKKTNTLPITHCFPSIFANLPKTQSRLTILLFVRDPRDVILSLIDYIGTSHWGGGRRVDFDWKSGSFFQKIDYVLDEKNWPYGNSIMGAFKTIETLLQNEENVCFRYEDLHPLHTGSIEKPVAEIIRLGEFFDVSIEQFQAEQILKHAFLKETPTLNKGCTRRYQNELSFEERAFLTDRLSHYIILLGYPLWE
jgi:hypothetical protein